ncbi:MAG: hypothetical protein A3J29_06135 [Acidobacteria bacterium RIFCSPLOWO2_12_FULL_67_14b]|nr:MAG: hypothetical protein A3J29_06135 [Acidobacteria bacterium RIFCSPLOWO2_12_FULL_67_14b]
MRIELPWFNRAKGGDAAPQLSDEGALLTQGVGGVSYHAARQRKVFTAPMAAAGGVLPIFSNTAQIFGLWNPAGSGVIANILELAMSFVDTTGAAGGYVLAVVKNAGAALATGGNISAFTDLTVYEALATGNAASGNKCRVSSAATVTAPVILRHLGLNQLVLTAADATGLQWKNTSRFDGDVLVAPNTALFVAGNIATLSKWACSVTWQEEPA